MEDLRTILFKETLYAFNEWMKWINEYGHWDSMVNIYKCKFSSLYRVIEDSGLENEYQIWKENQHNKSLEY